MSKIYQGNFQSLCRLAQLFLDISAVILRKKSEIVEEIFPALKMQLGDFIEISGNRFANTNIHRRKLKHPT